MLKKILLGVAILAAACFGVVAEDAAPAVVSCTSVLQTGASISLSPLAIHVVVPIPASVADDGALVKQDSPDVAGCLIWKFVAGHRADMKIAVTDPRVNGVPFAVEFLVGDFVFSCSGTPYTGTGAPISFVNASFPASGSQELFVSTGANGYVPNLNFSVSWKKKLLTGGGTVTCTFTITCLDIV
jgi:hypothetical protein